MASEFRRGTIRVVSNYGRLFATLALGLVLVPLLFRTIGPEATGLIGTLGASFGLAAIFLEIARESMIRELGAAHHHADPDVFLQVYNSAIFVSIGFAALSLLTFGVFLLAMPWILQSVDQSFVVPAIWFLVAVGIGASLEIILMPQINMMIVAERMVMFNVFSTVHRLAYVAMGLLLLWAWVDLTPQQGLVTIGVGVAIFQALIVIVMAAWLIFDDRRLVPRPWKASKATAKEVLTISSWNLGLGVAMRLHERAASIIMVIHFGAWGGNVFDQIAFRLASYIRMVATGVTGGTDAVAARLHSTHNYEGLRQLLRSSTGLHGMAVFPATIGLFVLAGPLITVWIAPSLDNPETIIPAATVMTQILVIGSASRSIADGWVRILYGAGHISSYAPLIFVGGLLNPVLSLLLLWVMPETWKYTAVAWIFSGILTVFHLGLLPLATAKLIGLRPRDMIAPLIRPALFAAGCAPILLFAHTDQHEHVSLIRIFLAGSAYAIVYMTLALFLLFPVEQRSRVLAYANKLVRRGSTH